MGENSNIEWTDHTFNIVWGCQRVSPACQNCYAEAFSHRLGKKLWGPNSERQIMSESYWRQPLKWNKQAEKLGVRKRVFCSSMADVFEDHETVNQERVKLWGLIEQTPNLDWLLLTKRPENIKQMLPVSWDAARRWPNVWLGTTVENQEWADKRIPHLLEVPAAVRFLSCEPLLGAVDIEQYLSRPLFYCNGCGKEKKRDYCHKCGTWDNSVTNEIVGVDLVICGGESGHGARPMAVDWARSLRDQCVDAGVAFHFKQWGSHIDVDSAINQLGFNPYAPHKEYVYVQGSALPYLPIDKHKAGRMLDGRTWDEMPSSNQASEI